MCLNFTTLYFGHSGKEVIKKIEHQPTNEKSRPYNPCTISNCGELVLVKKVKKLTAEDLTSSSGKLDFSPIFGSRLFDEISS